MPKIETREYMEALEAASEAAEGRWTEVLTAPIRVAVDLALEGPRRTQGRACVDAACGLLRQFEDRGIGLEGHGRRMTNLVARLLDLATECDQ